MSERNIPELLIPMSLAYWLDDEKPTCLNKFFEHPNQKMTVDDLVSVIGNEIEPVVRWLVHEGVIRRPEYADADGWYYWVIKSVRLVHAYSVLDAAINPKWTTTEKAQFVLAEVGYPNLTIDRASEKLYLCLTSSKFVLVNPSDLLRYVEDGLRKDGKL